MRSGNAGGKMVVCEFWPWQWTRNVRLQFLFFTCLLYFLTKMFFVLLPERQAFVAWTLVNVLHVIEHALCCSTPCLYFPYVTQAWYTPLNLYGKIKANDMPLVWLYPNLYLCRTHYLFSPNNVFGYIPNLQSFNLLLPHVTWLPTLQATQKCETRLKPKRFWFI